MSKKIVSDTITNAIPTPAAQYHIPQVGDARYGMERFHAKLDKALRHLDPSIGEAEINKRVQEELDQHDEIDDAWDALEKANVRAKKGRFDLARKWALKTLEIDPDNKEAHFFLLEIEDDLLLQLQEVQGLITLWREQLRRSHLLTPEYHGTLWDMPAAQPYLRMLSIKLTILMTLGRYTEAITAGEELLEWDAEDHRDARYKLIGLYTILERFNDLSRWLNIFSEPDETEEQSARFMLIGAIATYKLGEYERCLAYIDRLNALNPLVLLVILMDDSVFTGLPVSRDNADADLGDEAAAIVADYRMVIDSTPSFLMFVMLNSKLPDKKPVFYRGLRGSPENYGIHMDATVDDDDLSQLYQASDDDSGIPTINDDASAKKHHD